LNLDVKTLHRAAI
jgi:DNA-binding MarR family transcriptional regulator